MRIWKNIEHLFEKSYTGIRKMPDFRIVSDFGMMGDQPEAVDKLVEGLEKGYHHQTLLGVTGSGKTFTMANVVERVQRPSLTMPLNISSVTTTTTSPKPIFLTVTST
jgi:excinuclease UvrABC helicase subunit UvrB